MRVIQVYDGDGTPEVVDLWIDYVCLEHSKEEFQRKLAKGTLNVCIDWTQEQQDAYALLKRHEHQTVLLRLRLVRLSERSETESIVWQGCGNLGLCWYDWYKGTIQGLCFNFRLTATQTGAND